MTHRCRSAALFGFEMALTLMIDMGTAPARAADVKTLVVDTTFQLKTADPAREYEPTANLVLHPVYETLVTFKGGDLTEVVPSLASLPVVASDVKRFTFTLNPAARFSDGTPVTVEDAIFSLDRVKNLKGSPSFLLDGVTVAKGDKPGEVVLTTEQPDPGLPYKLSNPALGIVNARVVKAHRGSDGADANKADGAESFFASTSVGSGPYKLAKFDIASEVVLVRNNAYWGDKPTFDRVVVRNADSSAQQMSVARGDSQIALDLRPDQLDAVRSTAAVQSFPSADVVFMFTNSDPAVSPVAANPEFKKAVSLGIDYAGLLNFVGEGAVRPGSIIPSMFAGSLPESEGSRRDVAAAKAALARSGIAKPTVSLGYASDITRYGVAFGDVAAKIQADLKEVGITVELKPAPFATYLDAYRAGTLQMGIAYWGPDFPDPSNYLLFGPGKKVGLRAGWKAAATRDIDVLADKAAVEIDQANRIKLYQEWQRRLDTEGPFVSLFQPAFSMASARTLKPIEYNAMWLIDLAAVAPGRS